MRIITTILLLFISGYSEAAFRLTSIELDEATFQACTYCDARSDRAGSRASANALREFMTRNHLDIVLNKRDVKLEKKLPNEDIPTGHSCKYRAEARNVIGRALMIPGTVNLGPEGVGYFDEIKNSIAAADVAHAVEAEFDVRVKGGIKIFGSCKRIWRKTCHTDGSSEGINRVLVNLLASNTLVECINNQEHLTFNIDVNVDDIAKADTYKDIVVGKKNSCDLNVFGIKIGSINSKIRDYANKYLRGNEGIRSLRGPELVKELERVLGVELGSIVTIPITFRGSPRTCSSRQKRSTSRCTARKSCPDGYTRIGDTDKCQRYMGMSKPSCPIPGSNVYTKKFGTMTLYWCQTPMV